MILIVLTDSRQKDPDNSNIAYRESTKESRQFQYYLQTVDKGIPTLPILPADSRQKYSDDYNIPYRQSANVSRHNAKFPTDSRQKYSDDSNITHRQSTKVSRQFQYYLQTVDKGIPTLPILPADSRQNIPTIIIFPTDSRQKYPDDSNITYRQ